MDAKILRAAHGFELKELVSENQFSWDDFIFFYYLLCGMKEVYNTRDPHCPVSFHIVLMNYNSLSLGTECVHDLCQGLLFPEDDDHGRIPRIFD